MIFDGAALLLGGEGSLQLPLQLSKRRRTAEMLRGVYPERSERAQPDSRAVALNLRCA